MPRIVYGVVSFLILAMVLAAPVVEAQSRLVVEVPFAFNLGDRTMSAAQYEVSSRGEQVELIRDLDTGVAQFVIKAQHVQSRQIRPAMLIFNRYGNEYFLSQIWDGASDSGIQLAQSHREKEMSVAENGASGRPQTVVLAMQ